MHANHKHKSAQQQLIGQRVRGIKGVSVIFFKRRLNK